MRSAASSARAGPLARATSAGTVSRHSSLGLKALEAPGSRLEEGLRGDLEPEHDPGLLLHDSRCGDRIRGHHRLGGDVAGPQVLSQGAGDDVAQLLAICHPR